MPQRSCFWELGEASKCLSDRRRFLFSGGSLALLPWVGQIAEGVAASRNSFAFDPFQLGVASGDPDETGFVLWTRLAPKPLEEDGGMPPEDVEVTWEISDDESMKKILKSGKALAKAALGHSVHIEVSGLEPDRWYCYRFQCGDAVSRVARTRTMPAVDSMPERLRFAFASCQHYETGLYTAYQHMERESLDLILHLGDYIYEGGKAKNERVRYHVGKEIRSLEDYRVRHALYKTDRSLQAAHAMAPWLVVWDDHELDNNYANLIPEEAGLEPEGFALRRAAAYQAYYENMPLRASSLPKGPDMQLFRRIHYGQLAQFDMLDTRQYRTDQPNGDGRKALVGDVFSQEATMLGADQERWLLEGLDTSTAKWNIFGQQVMMARVDRVVGDGEGYSMDQWSGYDAPRRRFLKEVADRRKTGAVVLTGDIHNNWANHLLEDFSEPESRIIATELVGTSISSSGNGTAKPEYLDGLLAENPFVKFHNAERGYVTCEVTPMEWVAKYQTVPFVDQPDAPLYTRATFHISQDRPGLEA